MYYMGPRSPWKGAIFVETVAHLQYRDFLPSGVQKRMNRSIRCSGCGLRWAEGSTSSIAFTNRWRQCALTGEHKSATWRIRLNRPSVAVMRPYVKLL